MNKTIIGGVVLRDKSGRYLLVQEAKKHVRHLWNLPAGRADAGETPQMAAIREAQEETGFRVELTSQEPLVVDSNLREKNHVFYGFPARIVSGKLAIPERELLDVRWLSFIEIEALYKAGKLRAPVVINTIRKVENNENFRH